MSGERIAFLSTMLTMLAGAVGWLVKRQATKRDEAERTARELEQAQQAERVAHAPELQKIVAEQVESLLAVQSQRIEELVRENQDQRLRHREERDEWNRQRRRLEEVIDGLREELAELKRHPGRRTRQGDGNG